MEKNDVEILKAYVKNLIDAGHNIDATFHLTNSNQFYIIIESFYGLRACYVNDFGNVEQIGKLNYRCSKDGLFISYVESNLYKEGVGTELVRGAFRIAKRNGCNRVFLYSLNGAKGFYKKLGFTEGKKIEEHDLTEFSRFVDFKRNKKNTNSI